MEGKSFALDGSSSIRGINLLAGRSHSYAMSFLLCTAHTLLDSILDSKSQSFARAKLELFTIQAIFASNMKCSVQTCQSLGSLLEFKQSSRER